MSERYVIQLANGGRIIYRVAAKRVGHLLWKVTAVGGLSVEHSAYGLTERAAQRRLEAAVDRMYRWRIEL